MRLNLKRAAAGLLAAAVMAAALPTGGFAQEADAAVQKEEAGSQSQSQSEISEQPAESAAESIAESISESIAESAASSEEESAAESVPEAAASSEAEAPASSAEETMLAAVADTLTFDRRMADGVQPSDIVEIGPDMVFPAEPSLADEGFTFAGWYTGIDGTGDEITLEAAKQLDDEEFVYAKWLTVDGKTVCTKPLDLLSGASCSNAEQGWAWDADTKTLTLDNASFYVVAPLSAPDELRPAIALPDGAAINTADNTASIVKSRDMAIFCEGTVTVSSLGSGKGLFDAIGGLYSDIEEYGIYANGNITFDNIVAAFEGTDRAVFSVNDIIFQNNADVVCFSSKGGVCAMGNIGIDKSRLATALDSENAENPIGIWSAGTITVSNGSVEGYGSFCGVYATGGIIADNPAVINSDVGSDVEFVSGKTTTLAQRDKENPVVLQQDNRTLLYDPAAGKMYGGGTADNPQDEITILRGWDTDADTGALMLNGFIFTTTAPTALCILGDCSITISGDNYLAARNRPEGETSSVGVMVKGNLTLTNYNDPDAALDIFSGNITCKTQGDDMLTSGLYVDGSLKADNVEMIVGSGDAMGPDDIRVGVESIGLYAKNDITMNNVKLLAAGGNAQNTGDIGSNCISRGIFTTGSITLNGCQTDVISGRAGLSEGVYCYDPGRADKDNVPVWFNINGGALSSSTDSATLYSVGIAVYNLNITNGAKVEAEATAARDFCHGIFVRNLIVNNASLDAYGTMGAARIGTSFTLENAKIYGYNDTTKLFDVPVALECTQESLPGKLFTAIGGTQPLTAIRITPGSAPADTPQTPAISTIPQTGDETPLALLAILMSASALTAAYIIMRRKKAK